MCPAKALYLARQPYMRLNIISLTVYYRDILLTKHQIWPARLKKIYIWPAYDLSCALLV